MSTPPPPTKLQVSILICVSALMLIYRLQQQMKIIFTVSLGYENQSQNRGLQKSVWDFLRSPNLSYTLLTG